jgi:quinohemoprotein ethanol dehydrogenase
VTLLDAQQTRQPNATALRNASQSKEWLTYGGSYSETRFSPLKQIDATNVDRLGLAWTYVLGTGGGNQEATPLFSNGVLYGITNYSIAFAVDARTGKELWRFDPQVSRGFTTGPTNGGVCCGILNRGVALFEGKVIIPVLDRRLIALDAATGKPVWTTRILPEDATGYSLTMVRFDMSILLFNPVLDLLKDISEQRNISETLKSRSTHARAIVRR